MLNVPLLDIPISLYVYAKVFVHKEREGTMNAANVRKLG